MVAVQLQQRRGPARFPQPPLPLPSPRSVAAAFWLRGDVPLLPGGPARHSPATRPRRRCGSRAVQAHFTLILSLMPTVRLLFQTSSIPLPSKTLTALFQCSFPPAGAEVHRVEHPGGVVVQPSAAQGYRVHRQPAGLIFLPKIAPNRDLLAQQPARAGAGARPAILRPHRTERNQSSVVALAESNARRTSLSKRRWSCA